MISPRVVRIFSYVFSNKLLVWPSKRYRNCRKSIIWSLNFNFSVVFNTVCCMYVLLRNSSCFRNSKWWWWSNSADFDGLLRNLNLNLKKFIVIERIMSGCQYGSKLLTAVMEHSPNGLYWCGNWNRGIEFLRALIMRGIKLMTAKWCANRIAGVWSCFWSHIPSPWVPEHRRYVLHSKYQ